MESKNQGITSSVLELIGNTPLLALDRIWPGPGRLLAKCEFLNPTASLKDRSALYMIQEAEKKGLIKPGQGLIELTSGNQGAGLAMCANVLGHKFTVIMVSRAILSMQLKITNHLLNCFRFFLELFSRKSKQQILIHKLKFLTSRKATVSRDES